MWAMACNPNTAHIFLGVGVPQGRGLLHYAAVGERGKIRAKVQANLALTRSPHSCMRSLANTYA
jgi:hypothetical protein